MAMVVMVLVMVYHAQRKDREWVEVTIQVIIINIIDGISIPRRHKYMGKVLCIFSLPHTVR